LHKLRMLTTKQVENFKVKELKKELEARNLSTKGRKADLQKRLIEFLEKNSESQKDRKSPGKRRRDEKNDKAPHSKRAKKEEPVKYLSDDEVDDNMQVGKEEKEGEQPKSEEVAKTKSATESKRASLQEKKAKLQEALSKEQQPLQKSDPVKKEAQPSKKENSTKKEAPVQRAKAPLKKEHSKKESAVKRKREEAPSKKRAFEKGALEKREPAKKAKVVSSPPPDELDFSGAEEAEFSGAEMSDEESEDWAAAFRDGITSPPPPEFLNRSKFRSRWGSGSTQASAKQILPELPSKEQLASLSITAMQDRIASELSALTRSATMGDPSEFMRSAGKDFKEVEEPTLERDEGAEIDPHLYDPRVGSGPESRRLRKRGKALHFFKKGSLVHKANRIAQLLERQYIHATPSAAAAAELDDDVNYLSGDEKGEDIPEMEWWDKPYTGEKGYGATLEELKLKLITHYIHNPAALGEFNTETAKVQLPLYLTRKEKDKIKRKKSKDKHDAMIDEIRLGIREPPEPKLKVSNIVRVLGSKFIQDPSAAEAKARTQEALRLMKHQLHNENRKLTKSQRSEKKRKQLLEDTSKMVHTAVFRVDNLSDSKIRWKIKTNAKQYNLTGCMMLYKRMNMVMVEGGPKAITKYAALMNRRIQWSQVDNASPCMQVWEGVTGAHVFRDFVIETFEEEADVIKYLDQKKVLGYWKQCKNHQQHMTY